MKETIITHTPAETEEAGARLAGYIQNLGKETSFTALYGDLGAGKTVFVRGFVSVLAPNAHVKSPTYTMVLEYPPVYHFDLYRIADADELYAIGFDDYLRRGHCIVEWSEHLHDEMPRHPTKVWIDKDEHDPDRRMITIEYDADA